MKTLRITEIFHSLQGEANTVGIPTVFVRLTGCPLRCQYCDTTYAFKGGTVMSIEDIVAQVVTYQTRYITVTGGEPLAQRECLDLLSALCHQHYIVSLETSGALSVSAVDPRVVKVIDLKTAGSGECERNDYTNLNYLQKQDQIKFVICNREDYEWSKKMIQTHKLDEQCEVLFSPSHHQLTNQILAEWILQDRLPVRFQVQLHKYIWGEVAGK